MLFASTALGLKTLNILLKCVISLANTIYNILLMLPFSIERANMAVACFMGLFVFSQQVGNSSSFFRHQQLTRCQIKEVMNNYFEGLNFVSQMQSAF